MPWATWLEKWSRSCSSSGHPSLSRSADVFLFQVDVLVARVLARTQAGSQHGLSLPSKKVEQVAIATVLSDDQDRA